MPSRQVKKRGKLVAVKLINKDSDYCRSIAVAVAVLHDLKPSYLSNALLGELLGALSLSIFFSFPSSFSIFNSINRVYQMKSYIPLSVCPRQFLPTSRLSPKTCTRYASSKRWQARQSKDKFTKEAAVQGLKSRAAFKLLQVCSRDCK